RRAPIAALFPYTTLFRSLLAMAFLSAAQGGKAEPAMCIWAATVYKEGQALAAESAELLTLATAASLSSMPVATQLMASRQSAKRSEEHTSELQSRENLVC